MGTEAKQHTKIAHKKRKKQQKQHNEPSLLLHTIPTNCTVHYTKNTSFPLLVFSLFALERRSGSLLVHCTMYILPLDEI